MSFDGETEIKDPIHYFFLQTKFNELNNGTSTSLLPMADFLDFVNAISWKETFIIGLISFHVLFFLSAVATRRQQTVQMLLMMLITGLVVSARRINGLGQQYWRKFATQNYFDHQGIFMLIFFCAPLLLTATFIVVWLFLFLLVAQLYNLPEYLLITLTFAFPVCFYQFCLKLNTLRVLFNVAVRAKRMQLKQQHKSTQGQKTDEDTKKMQ